MIQARRPTVVVVGTGMAGGKVVEEILTRAADRFHVRMFGDEPHGTYNRILLSGVLGGFADLTTRQQIQLRWFTLGDVPEIWRRLEAVGLHSMQTGLDNVRGICGCRLSGLTPHELLDATPCSSAIAPSRTCRASST